MTITISGGTIGMINTGTIENAGVISANVVAGGRVTLFPRRTIVVSDLHGDVEGARALLVGLDAIDRETGHRTRPNTDTIIQIGDLIHGGQNRGNSDDREMLRRVVGWSWFDRIVIGNHDAPHLYPTAGLPGFAGMARLTTEAQAHLATLRDSGVYTIAHAHEGYLITHAGLRPLYLRGLVEQADWGDPHCIAEGLRALFARRIQTTGEAPVFDDLGFARGGWAEGGGVLWCDYAELTAGERPSTPQIVGHTPYYDGDATQGVTWGVGRDEEWDIWRVDSGSALSGVVCCIVQDAPGEPFRPVVFRHREV